jgi:anti-sigma B factor antagonist
MSDRRAAASSQVARHLNFSFESGPRGVLVLHCEGKLIYQNEARKLAAIVTEILPTVQRMVVDLSDVNSVDSAGLGELVLAQMWADAAGFELKFAAPNRSVRHLLELANLASVFDLHASIPQAMASMGGEEVPPS